VPATLAGQTSHGGGVGIIPGSTVQVFSGLGFTGSGLKPFFLGERGQVNVIALLHTYSFSFLTDKVL